VGPQLRDAQRVQETLYRTSLGITTMKVTPGAMEVICGLAMSWRGANPDGGRLRLPRWIGASWWIRCALAPSINHQARINHANLRHIG
jgi:hypothetical protein